MKEINVSSTYEIQLEITNKCSLKCKHCSNSSINMSSSIGYKLIDITDLIDASAVKYDINLTGGEPLEHCSLIEVIKELRSHNNVNSIGLFSSGVISSGNKCDYVDIDFAKSLESAGLSSASISLYHSIDTYHDKITGRKGSFTCSINTIENLIMSGIHVKAHLVVNKYNIRDLENTLIRLKCIGLPEVRLLRIVKTGNAITNWDEIGVDYNDQNEFICNVIKSKNNKLPILSVSGYPEISSCRPYNDSIKCQAGSRICYINFDGMVYPCACTIGKKDYIVSHVSDKDKIVEYIKSSLGKHNELCLNVEL